MRTPSLTSTTLNLSNDTTNFFSQTKSKFSWDILDINPQVPKRKTEIDIKPVTQTEAQMLFQANSFHIPPRKVYGKESFIFKRDDSSRKEKLKEVIQTEQSPKTIRRPRHDEYSYRKVDKGLSFFESTSSQIDVSEGRRQRVMSLRKSS